MGENLYYLVKITIRFEDILKELDIMDERAKSTTMSLLTKFFNWSYVKQTRL